MKFFLPLLVGLLAWALMPAAGATTLPPAADSLSVEALRARLRQPTLPAAARVRATVQLLDQLPLGEATLREGRAAVLQALPLARHLGNASQETQLLIHLSRIAGQTGDLVAAYRYANQALARARAAHLREDLDLIYCQLGMITFEQQDYPQARTLLEMALTEAHRQGLTDRRLTTVLVVLMQTQQELRQWPAAGRSFREALALNRAAADTMATFQVLAAYGTGLRTVRPDSAARYLGQALQLARHTRDPYALAYAHLGLMQVRQQQHQWADARHEAHQTLAYARTSEAPDYVQEALATLAESLYHLGRPVAAYDTLRLANTLLDSLRSDEKRQELNQLRIRYELGEKDARIGALEQARRIARLQAAQQQARTRTLAVAAVALLVVLLAVGLLLTWALRQRRRLQASEAALQTANHTKDQLIRIVGHDLRSPMASLQQLTPLLHDLFEQPPAERAAAHQLIRTLDAGAQHLGGMVDNLFQWARAQGGQLINHPQPLRVAFAVQSIGALYGPMAQLKGITLTATTTPPDLVAVADLALLTTVLRNLVGNALKFTPKNGQVHLLAHATPGGQVAFSVRDTGPGIAPDRLTELRTADQLPSTPGTAGEPGTGLGLPLSARFVRLLGGELLITSAPGEGTRAAFQLPGGVGLARDGA